MWRRLANVAAGYPVSGSWVRGVPLWPLRDGEGGQGAVTGRALEPESRGKTKKNQSQPLNGSFWTSPRKTSLRRWSFYIHFYAGLIAGILFSVVGITVSILVFVPELRVLEVPGHAPVLPPRPPLPL